MHAVTTRELPWGCKWHVGGVPTVVEHGVDKVSLVGVVSGDYSIEGYMSVRSSTS